MVRPRFLTGSRANGDIEEELRFLQELVRQVGPAVYNVYLLRRLRLRAGALERARFAREFHDGAVQSLIAVEMQVDVLRRQSATSPSKSRRSWAGFRDCCGKKSSSCGNSCSR